MTVKVFHHDGKAQEFPNANITWEWDDSEEGYNSGWRIRAIDRNCTTVSAFVCPSDCTKIEITHEESDMVFKSPPCDNAISGKRFRIFAEIEQERKRQEEKWGEQNHPMLNEKLYSPNDCLESLSHFRSYNDYGEHKNWFAILMEEIYEAFSETNTERQRKELVQTAAVLVQMIECLDRKRADATKVDEPDARFGYCSRCENLSDDCVCNNEDDAIDSRFWGDSDRDIDPDMGAH